MGRFVVLVAMIALTAGSGICLGDDEKAPKDPLPLLEPGKEISIQDYDSLVDDMIAYRYEIGARLIMMLKCERSDEKKARICFLMGEYQSPGALSVLAENLSLEIDWGATNWTRPPLITKYPAQQALVRFGYMSIPLMMKTVRSDEDEKRRELATQVIYEVMTPHIARYAITMEAEKEADEQKKANLLDALKWIPRPRER